MGLVAWIRTLWQKNEQAYEQKTYACPKCGCTDLGYFNVICNFVQVIRGTEEPRYIQSVKCTNCGYKEESEDNSHLKYFEVTKNVSKKN